MSIHIIRTKFCNYSTHLALFPRVSPLSHPVILWKEMRYSQILLSPLQMKITKTRQLHKISALGPSFNQISSARSNIPPKTHMGVFEHGNTPKFHGFEPHFPIQTTRPWRKTLKSQGVPPGLASASTTARHFLSKASSSPESSDFPMNLAQLRLNCRQPTIMRDFTYTI